MTQGVLDKHLHFEEITKEVRGLTLEEINEVGNEEMEKFYKFMEEEFWENGGYY